MTLSKRLWIRWGVIALLLFLNIGLVYVVCIRTEKSLRVSFLDVGQGDSILIQGPTGIDVVIDGGPDRSVVRELPKLLGPLDRHIDMVIETHPDKDHIAGLADVFEMYDVDVFMNPGLPSDTDVYARLVAIATKEDGLVTYVARRGQRIHLGDGAYADVLYPDKDVSRLRATNDASIVLHVVYGDTSFMLTGDLPSTIEDTLVREISTNDLRSTVLKAGHHGSKYSTSALWLEAVQPRTVVISAGKGNTYGHPAPEVLSRVRTFGASIVSTIDSGTITYISDGATPRRK